MNAVADAGFQVDIRPIPDGLHVHVQGLENYANALAYWHEIARAAQGDGVRQVLLVDELRGTPLTEAEWLQLVLSMADVDLLYVGLRLVLAPAHKIREAHR